MSEISELTKKIDAFILKFSPVMGSHTKAIETGEKERGSLFSKIEGKNGLTSRIKGVETREKVRSGFFSGILGIVGIVVSVVVMLILLFKYMGGTDDRYRGVNATRDLGMIEKRLEYLEAHNLKED